MYLNSRLGVQKPRQPAPCSGFIFSRYSPFYCNRSLALVFTLLYFYFLQRTAGLGMTNFLGQSFVYIKSGFRYEARVSYRAFVSGGMWITDGGMEFFLGVAQVARQALGHTCTWSFSFFNPSCADGVEGSGTRSTVSAAPGCMIERGGGGATGEGARVLFCIQVHDGPVAAGMCTCKTYVGAKHSVQSNHHTFFSAAHST